jgi:DNA-binding MarR family transcriptional regulator
MSKKTEFIRVVEMLCDYSNFNWEDEEDARAYWEAFKGKEEVEKPLFTDNGKLILKYLQDNPDLKTTKAKDIGEGLFISSRAVSGAIRKLVNDGFVEKIGQDPVMYSITDKGRTVEIV